MGLESLFLLRRSMERVLEVLVLGNCGERQDR